MSPSPREGRAGGGSGSTAIELSELRQDRSADFSPLPAVLAGPERGGLKSALLNSMAVLSGSLPARSTRERKTNCSLLLIACSDAVREIRCLSQLRILLSRRAKPELSTGYPTSNLVSKSF